jgi:hypothetical protein
MITVLYAEIGGSPIARIKRFLTAIFPLVGSSSASNIMLIEFAKSLVRYNHVKEM